MKEKAKSKKSNYTLLVFSFLLIMISSYALLLRFQEVKHIEEITRSLNTTKKEESSIDEDNTWINPPQDKEDPYWDYIETPFLQIDFSNLLEQNQDTVGWIQVGGTKIDYPITQSTDNQYYLTHSFDHTLSKAGWIYSDFRNNFQSLNPNTVIYGHGRLDNTMFGSLREVLKEEWYQDKSNHIIKLSTPITNMIWQIFSVYQIPKEDYYITTHFENENSYQTFLDTIKNRSIFAFSTSVDTNDKILTLSTCKDNYGQRIVVHAKLIKKETRSF